jgi:Adenylate and Guanylate cyclase catalytic domain
MFADISGFTAWSSCKCVVAGCCPNKQARSSLCVDLAYLYVVRDPSQVFKLLEAVYSAFDAIARRRGVFKVETIGDSYVCVTYVDGLFRYRILLSVSHTQYPVAYRTLNKNMR